MKISDIENRIYEEIGKEEKLITSHNIIYKLIGIVIDYINIEYKAMNLLKSDHLNPYCAQLQGKVPEKCQCFSKTYIDSARKLHKPLIYKCHAGLNDVVYPLYDQNEQYIGAMTAGQFFIAGETPQSRQFISTLAANNHLNSENLYALYRNSPVLSTRQIEGLFDYLKEIGELITSNRNKILFWEKSNATERISLIKKYIHQNYYKNLTVSDMAKRFYLSPNHFCRLFKMKTGVTFITYLNLYRISQAEKLLENSDLNIYDISAQCGFQSTAQFYRYFKQVHNQTSSSYRHNALKCK